MGDTLSLVVDELAPREAFDALNQSPNAAIVDVRTRAEWAFTGLPDVTSIGKPLWTIEWVSFPTMAPNTTFLDQLMDNAQGTLPDRLFFICRSGHRSMAAAQSVAAMCQDRNQSIHCTNIAEGFEGDLDAERHRGSRNGWKVHGLPWRQS